MNGDKVQLHPGGSADRWRPAIDLLFGSSAESHGPRVAAFVVTGFLDDGAAGLARAAGGATVVQVPTMRERPHADQRNPSAQPDYRLPLTAIPPVLA